MFSTSKNSFILIPRDYFNKINMLITLLRDKSFNEDYFIIQIKRFSHFFVMAMNTRFYKTYNKRLKKLEYGSHILTRQVKSKTFGFIFLFDDTI